MARLSAAGADRGAPAPPAAGAATGGTGAPFAGMAASGVKVLPDAAEDPVAAHRAI